MLSFVWAQDQNGLIGKDGQLPWHLPNDLHFFKELTLNHTIVMGRATFEGMNKRLLPKRHTIVLTNQNDYDGAGAEVVHSIETILDEAQSEDIFIVGGATIYQLFAPYVDILYRTIIYESFEGDVYFPNLDWEQFVLVKEVEGKVDDKNLYPHSFQLFTRK